MSGGGPDRQHCAVHTAYGGSPRLWVPPTSQREKHGSGSDRCVSESSMDAGPMRRGDSNSLVGYPQGGPSAYVTAEDAVPLRQALAAAFGSEQSAGNKVAIPGSDLMRGTATQP